ncbi:hypothetical protein RHMOL_Rhmol10G0013400 [Rhododendron molle]|uniref:Uncharacterized protein n=1 Tax=Rhododendron molle TaxID=49168 RepID=A0ACC0LZE9_RHOML|nr:hypothetical protein RHMOL_Rhmol10G0013400 [Rhododendron molle]
METRIAALETTLPVSRREIEVQTPGGMMGVLEVPRVAPPLDLTSVQRCAPELCREWFSERVVLVGVEELGELEAELRVVVSTGAEVLTEAVAPEVEVPGGAERGGAAGAGSAGAGRAARGASRGAGGPSRGGGRRAGRSPSPGRGSSQSMSPPPRAERRRPLMKQAGGGPTTPPSDRVLRGRQPSADRPGGSAPGSSALPSRWSFREAASSEEEDASPSEPETLVPRSRKRPRA